MYKDMEWRRNVLRNGIGFFRHSATIFGTVSLFQEKNIELFSRAPARIIITARTNHDAFG